MNVHSARVDIDIAAPNVVEQLVAAEDTAGFLKQRRQQPVLCRPQFQFIARTAYAVALWIKLDVIEAEQRACGCWSRAPQLRSHPRHEFAQIVWLDHIVIRAGLKELSPT